MFAQEPLPEIDVISARLQEIFPEGLSDRNYLVRKVAAQTVFVALYINAVEGEDVWLGPVSVYRMSKSQSELQSEPARLAYSRDLKAKRYRVPDDRWMQDNSREQVRDETLAEGLCPKGAVIEKEDVTTTASHGRYALRRSFAELFTVPDSDFAEAAEKWRAHYLSREEQARVHILRTRTNTPGTVMVKFPTGESRALSIGVSSELAKGVIEDFAPRYLRRPVVLWLSESRTHVVAQDHELMAAIGLEIQAADMLPDLVLADVAAPMKIVFVELVATDGPITAERQSRIFSMVERAKFPRANVSFVSVFRHRDSAPLKRRLSGIALQSFIWCISEPDMLIWISEGGPMPLQRLTS